MTNQKPAKLLQIDDCEDGNGITLLGTYWFTYDDSDNGGNSEVYPAPGTFRMTEPGANNSRFCAQMTGVVRRRFESGFIGIGFDLQKPKGIRDISAYEGIRFYATGDGKRYQVRIHCSSTSDWDDFRYVFAAPINEWKLFEVPFSQFSQEGWGAPARWTGRNAISVVWQTVGQPHRSIQLAVDDIAFFG
jgi:licheninase